MSIYMDTSSKSDGKGTQGRRHWIWRLDIQIDGKRIRCRSKDYNHLAGITVEEAISIANDLDYDEWEE